jgi:hypothetical protein
VGRGLGLLSPSRSHTRERVVAGIEYAKKYGEVGPFHRPTEGNIPSRPSESAESATPVMAGNCALWVPAVPAFAGLVKPKPLPVTHAKTLILTFWLAIYARFRCHMPSHRSPSPQCRTGVSSNPPVCLVIVRAWGRSRHQETGSRQSGKWRNPEGRGIFGKVFANTITIYMYLPKSHDT